MKSAALTVVRQKPIALVDLNVPQLEEAHVMLEQKAGQHDHAYTLCCLLDGIVLTELKRRLGHGKFGPWLGKQYSNSQRTANLRMRAAADFLMKLQDSRFRKRAEFDLQAGVDVLRQDLGKTLEQIERAKLDLSHPLVRAAAAYAKGRSFTQILLDLGPAAGSYDRTARGKGKTGVTAQPLDKQAEEIFLPAAQEFSSRFREGLWRHLPRRILTRLDGDLLDIRAELKQHLNGGGQ